MNRYQMLLYNSIEMVHFCTCTNGLLLFLLYLKFAFSSGKHQLLSWNNFFFFLNIFEHFQFEHSQSVRKIANLLFVSYKEQRSTSASIAMHFVSLFICLYFCALECQRRRQKAHQCNIQRDNCNETVKQ